MLIGVAKFSMNKDKYRSVENKLYGNQVVKPNNIPIQVGNIQVKSDG